MEGSWVGWWAGAWPDISGRSPVRPHCPWGLSVPVGLSGALSLGLWVPVQVAPIPDTWVRPHHWDLPACGEGLPGLSGWQARPAWPPSSPRLPCLRRRPRDPRAPGCSCWRPSSRGRCPSSSNCTCCARTASPPSSAPSPSTSSAARPWPSGAQPCSPAAVGVGSAGAPRLVAPPHPLHHQGRRCPDRQVDMMGPELPSREAALGGPSLPPRPSTCSAPTTLSLAGGGGEGGPVK